MPERSAIEEAARRLRAGGLVAFPTETVYGLGADALNAEAVRRVFLAKGRPSHNPLIVHVDGEAMARRVVSAWPEEARRLAEAFWPGPLTIVLPKAEGVPAEVTAGGATVAVRRPDHPVAEALIRAFGGPIVGPSANRSGHVSPTASAHVRMEFPESEGELGVLVLEGGPCRVGLESTVVKVDPGGLEAPRVLRPGVIGADELARVLGQAVASAEQGRERRSEGSSERLESPGLLGRHYAPRTPAVLVLKEELSARLAEHGKAVVLADASRAEVVVAPHVLVRVPREADRGYAARLYAALREADRAHADVILIEEPRDPGTPLFAAIRDRLLRATSEEG